MVSAYLYSDLVLWWCELSFYGHAICDMYPNKVHLDQSLILNKTKISFEPKFITSIWLAPQSLFLKKSKNVNPPLHTNPLHHQHNDSCTSTPIVGMPGQMKDESVRAATLSDFNQHQCHACHLEPFLQYRNNSGPWNTKLLTMCTPFCVKNI